MLKKELSLAVVCHLYHLSMQAAVLLLFLVGQVIIRMKNDTLYLEHNSNKLILLLGQKGMLSSKEIQKYATRIGVGDMF